MNYIKYIFSVVCGTKIHSGIVRAEFTEKTEEILNFFNGKFIVGIDDSQISYIINIIKDLYPDLETWRDILKRSKYNTKNNVFEIDSNDEFLKNVIIIDNKGTLDNLFNVIKEAFENNNISNKYTFEDNSTLIEI